MFLADVLGLATLMISTLGPGSAPAAVPPATVPYGPPVPPSIFAPAPANPAPVIVVSSDPLPFPEAFVGQPVAPQPAAAQPQPIATPEPAAPPAPPTPGVSVDQRPSPTPTQTTQTAPAAPAVVNKFVTTTPAALKPIIAAASTRYGIPTDVLSAALARESAGFQDKYVYGYHVDGTGRGVAGIDKVFHPEVSDAQAFDPTFAIPWEARLLSQLVKEQHGDLYSALREYNGGPNFASNAIGYAGQTVSDLTKAHADAIMADAAKARP